MSHFTAPGATASISGLTMQDEIIRQKRDGGTLLSQTLFSHGIVPGFKEEMEARSVGVNNPAHRREWHDD